MPPKGKSYKILVIMGSSIINNDTLQLTKEQGFPTVLDLQHHLESPYQLEDFSDQVFEFHDKPEIRNYQAPPVRNFLVENKGGKWIYWGLVHILEVTHDYVYQKTSGKFKIIYLNTPEEMRQAHELIDRNPKTQYFT